MSTSPGFFSDAKVILSLVALSVSLISLIWTLANQWDQNRRWDNLNTAKIIIEEVRMTKWKSLTKDEATRTNWGYPPSIYAEGEGFNLFQIPYHLVSRDPATKEKAKGVNPVFTLDELQLELKRVGHQGKVMVSRLFRPKFVFRNTGKTDATDLSIEIDARLPNDDWRSAFKSNALVTLAASQPSTIVFDIEFPLEAEVPPVVNFNVKLTFKDANANLIKTEIKAKWTSNDNFWSYGEN